MAQMIDQRDFTAAHRPGLVFEPEGVATTRDTAGAQVYARIRRWLVAASLPIGSRIRVPDIAAELRVSNTPVREALIRLSTEGLIENRRGAGFFVPIPQLEEVAALFDACHLIVQGSLRQLILRGAASRFGDQRQVFADPKWRGDPAEVARLCSDFHLTVVTATDNTVLAAMLATIEDRLFPLRVIDAETPGVAERQLADIKAIMAATLADRAEGALDRLVGLHTDMRTRVSYLVERRILSGLRVAGDAGLVSA